MGYVAPTWQNGGPPALNAKNMQDISDNLAYVSNHMVNPNLLDNWYFGKPVNQRGQTSYTGRGYVIDLWQIMSSGLLVVGDTGITFQSTDGTSPYMFENLDEDNIAALKGRVVTASVLFSGGVDTKRCSVICYRPGNPGYTEFASLTVAGVGLGSFSFTTPSDTTKIEFRLQTGEWGVTGALSAAAAKLELGSQQTLAHQENGVWVLNEIPKFGEQLAACQRYYQVYTTAAARPAKALDCRPVMRTDPVQSTVNVGGTTLYANSAEL